MTAKTGFKNERYSVKTRAHIDIQRAYGEWIQEDYVWNWYVTLTFSHDVSPDKAKSRLFAYFNEIEELVRAPLGCIVTQEQARYSGLGKPGGRLHFHLLLYCAKPLTSDLLEDRWQKPCYGGNGTSGASAQAKPYNGAISASLYLFKDLHRPSSDWIAWRLHHPSKTRLKSYDCSSRVRRHWKREQERRLSSEEASDVA